MNAALTDDLDDFIARSREARFPNSANLFRGIEEDSFSQVIRYPVTQLCSEIAQIYRDRAMMADETSSYANRELYAEFSQIADALSESPDEPCRLWMFRGAFGNFCVFEMEQSQRIGACLIRD